MHANGQVIDVKIDDDGTVIFGRVQGSEPEPYEQWISLRYDLTAPTADGKPAGSEPIKVLLRYDVEPRRFALQHRPDLADVEVAGAEIREKNEAHRQPL